MAGSPTAPVAASTQVPTADEVTGTPLTAGTPSVPSLAAGASAQRACRTAIAELRELYAKQNIRLPTSVYLDAEGSLKGVFKSPSRTAKALHLQVLLLQFHLCPRCLRLQTSPPLVHLLLPRSVLVSLRQLLNVQLLLGLKKYLVITRFHVEGKSASAPQLPEQKRSLQRHSCRWHLQVRQSTVKTGCHEILFDTQ